MTFNLIHEAWLPVRRANTGDRLWIRPADISAIDGVVALDFPRPDWNAAVTEFLIGLFTCALAPEDDRQWAALWKEPPSPERLSEALARISFAFNLDGDGPQAFQDLDPLEDAEEKDIAQLLIDSPGAITLTKNTDHFVKRGLTPALCPSFAAVALITLQTYAPVGGAGHRTSLRGGGPLTTLIEPEISARDASTVSSLWRRLWANAPRLNPWDEPPFHLARDHPAWARIFPWLTSTRASEGKRVVGPDDGHPVFMPFFATPRRIRLVFAESERGTVVSTYRTRNYGANYVGWRHPLSPYRDDRKAGYLLPLHPASGVASYRDWLGMWGARDGQHQAQCLTWWTERASRLPEFGRRSIHVACASGFDMDNMKPLSWSESRVPFYAIEDAKCRDAFYRTVRLLIGGSEAAAGALRYQMRIALFGVEDRDGNFRLLDTSNTGEVGSEQSERFWRVTENGFRGILDTLSKLDDPSDESGAIRKEWLREIKQAALRIFDGDIAPEDAWNGNPKRIVHARASLARAFSDSGKVWKAVGLAPPVKPKKTANLGTRA